MKARESIKNYTCTWFSKSYSCVVFLMIFMKFKYYFVAISLPNRTCDFCLKNIFNQKNSILKSTKYSRCLLIPGERDKRHLILISLKQEGDSQFLEDGHTSSSRSWGSVSESGITAILVILHTSWSPGSLPINAFWRIKSSHHGKSGKKGDQ